ncbi:glyoxal reductase [Thalassobacillus devorans]|uniref:Glyoxal reductase n=1 Tax=Thalassobacillus devorans TaxID=279813 RepID=A0ABQ1PT62_9BACI|nr:aldo/keto reductase [Thalassobacillus devorans]NIK30663.1 diketogulonate reductase-like aldo/keto reductase [Thalassobacillus devorans]GGD02759.1 glyoxal reductase [Thalassobacillus devorans]
MSLRETTKLRNQVEMPWVGLGVYKMEDGQEVVDSVKNALEIGYRHIDTASFYKNEEGVGQAIKESDVPREELFVTTKVWNDEQGYEDTLEAFDRSLHKLGLEYLDLYLIHWPVPGKFVDTWKALEKLYKDGKVKAIGVSNFLPHHLEEVMKDAEETPMVNQIELHPALHQQQTREFCEANEIQVVAWSPLARAKYFDAPVLKELSEKYDKTPAQIILRWDYQSGIVTIPKSVKEERQQENADIFDFELTEEEIKRIDELDLGEEGRNGPHPDTFDY